VSQAPECNAHPDGPPSPLRIALAFTAFLGVFVALLFLPAGRLDWGTGWLYLAIVTINSVINYACIRRKNPDLIEHRMRFGKGTKNWDKIWMGLFTPILVSLYLIAGLDAGRFGWSAMPLWLWPVGLSAFLSGTVLLTWSMVVNPFFEKTVRIQTERGHRVIDRGPYRFVRHPGYLGFFGWILSAPLLLGSWWAFLPSILSVGALVVRTALEDRTLREELPGYVDYAARVRFRLIPRVW
jgi:protein-S-isoprenylcysteine O-methyltransferase Ste14